MKRHTGILVVVGVVGAAVIGLAVACLATGGCKGSGGGICPFTGRCAPAKPSQPAANPTPAAQATGEAPTALKPGWANAICPIMGSPIDPEKVTPNLVRTFKGSKVAFCCAGCPVAWEKLSDKAKQAKLNASLPFANTRCPMMGSPIDPKNVAPELVRVFKGSKVAFCCAGCPAAWDKLSEAKKEAKLREAGGEN